MTDELIDEEIICAVCFQKFKPIVFTDNGPVCPLCNHVNGEEKEEDK